MKTPSSNVNTDINHFTALFQSRKMFCFQAVTATPTRLTQIPSVHSISSANSANAFSKVTHILSSYHYHTPVNFIFDLMAQ